MVRRFSSNPLIQRTDTGGARRENRRGPDELHGGHPRQILAEDHHTFTVILPAMFVKALLTVTIAFAAALPAWAQGPLPMWPEPTDAFVREAIGSPYARAPLAISSRLTRSQLESSGFG
jgi:hypothetical protein